MDPPIDILLIGSSWPGSQSDAVSTWVSVLRHKARWNGSDVCKHNQSIFHRNFQDVKLVGWGKSDGAAGLMLWQDCPCHLPGPSRPSTWWKDTAVRGLASDMVNQITPSPWRAAQLTQSCDSLWSATQVSPTVWKQSRICFFKILYLETRLWLYAKALEDYTVILR